MNSDMRILIAYDGSSSADAALDDLRRAGLPGNVKALVLTAGEIWFPSPPTVNLELMASTEVLQATNAPPGESRLSTMQSETEFIASQGAQRIREQFPHWEVTYEPCVGSPGSEVLIRAKQFKPDLIVVGSHGRSALGRIFLGSVSQKIVTEANCSVRIGRGPVEMDGDSLRILIATDGMSDSEAAIKTVASRQWPKGTQARLITAIGPVFSGIEAKEERLMAKEIQDAAIEELQDAGLEVSVLIQEGDPRRLITDEAEKWGASCIFVGCTGMKRIERFLIGSVSAAVAARAHCSVEVVRGKDENLF